MKKYLTNKKIIALIIVLILIVTGTTLAFYTWDYLEDTQINLVTGDIASIKYNEGQDIIVSNLAPVLDYNEGESTTFSVTKTINKTIYLDANLEITSIPIGLQEESFKCKILTSEDDIVYEEYDEINFYKKEEGTYSLISDYELNIETKYFKLIFYIDGHMLNHDDMKGQTLEATINVNIDEQMGSIFAYTGNYQEYIVPNDGYYKLEAWGAQGGHSKYTTQYYGGAGGYTSGIIYLEENEQLYIYIGGQGANVTGTTVANVENNRKGYNGGGSATFAASNSTGGGGGGATDFRTVKGEWNDVESLNSRIMVAAGGGGSKSHTSTPKYSGNGGVGGGLIGGNADFKSTTCYAYGLGGTQLLGGKVQTCSTDGHADSAVSIFGNGWPTFTNYYLFGLAYAGGGGGYYGGGRGYHSSGAGGSSFISGYAGVNAILESTDEANPRTHSGNTIHYSGKYFISGEMIPGTNDGNGKAQITYIGEKPERVNTNLDNVRYIKDCVNGYNATTGNHWVELQAIKDGVNIAYGITPTGTVVQNSSYPYSRITDGDITSTVYAASNSTGTQCITIDLTESYNLDEIAVWHYYVDGRTYKDNILSVSSDNINWIDIITETTAEISEGKRVNAYEK